MCVDGHRKSSCMASRAVLCFTRMRICKAELRMPLLLQYVFAYGRTKAFLLSEKIISMHAALGAATAGLLAWLFKRDGLDRTKCVAYACPACASPTFADETKDYVLTCVMRYDAVPRIAPRTIVAIEEELLNLSWEQMDVTADEWGTMGRLLFRRAKCARGPLNCHRPRLSTSFLLLVCQQCQPCGHGDP
jgi:Lipase (class 3)